MLEPQRIKKKHETALKNANRRLSLLPGRSPAPGNSKLKANFSRAQKARKSGSGRVSREHSTLGGHTSAKNEDMKDLGRGTNGPDNADEQEKMFMSRPQLESVDLSLIKNNICTKTQCYNEGFEGKPHRHRIEQCKDHPYCLDDDIKETIPIFSKVPQPMPIPNPDDPQLYRPYLEGIQHGQFGETGPQKPGTRTVPTQYSLDFYWAQQWNLDIDNFPGTLPSELDLVQKKFQSYSRRLLNKGPVKQTSKPTLQKKLNQWAKAQEEMRRDRAELAHWQTNLSPKVDDLLDLPGQKGRGQGRANSQNTTGAGKKIGKYTSLKNLSLASPRDMIPMVYPTTMQVEPIIVQLNREHEEITKMHMNNPGAQFSDLSAKYYLKKEMQEREVFRKMILGQGAKQQRENHLPSKQVKKRMDSEHLNSFMKHGEIQEVAERYIEFQKMLASMTEEQRDALRDYNKKQNEFVQPPTPEVIAEVDGEQFRAAAEELKSAAAKNQKSRSITKQSYKTAAAASLSVTESKRDRVSAQALQQQENGPPEKPSHKLILSTSASSANRFGGLKNRTLASPGATTWQSKPANKRARLFSAKSRGLTNFAAANSQHASFSLMPSMAAMIQNEQQQIVSGGGVQTPLLSSFNNIFEKEGNARLQGQRNEKTAHHTRTHSNMNQTGTERVAGNLTPQKTKSYAIITSGATPVVMASGTTTTEKTSEKDGSRPRHDHGLLLVENDHLNEQSGSVHDFNRTENVGNKVKSIFSTKAASNILNDLIEAQEVEDREKGRENVSQIFKSKRWQQEKDHLIESMNFHMSKHRPKIQLSADQERKKRELQSKKILGDALLQQRLAHQYGYKQNQAVKIPAECQKFMGEVPALMANKLKLDNQVWQGRKNQRNPCSREALSQKAFETLNKSTQRSDSQAQQLSRIHMQVSAAQVESGKTTASVSLVTDQNQDNRGASQKLTGLPKDPKPDIEEMTADRIQMFKRAYIDRISEVQKRDKPLWQLQKRADAIGSENAAESSFTKGQTHNTSINKLSRNGDTYRHNTSRMVHNPSYSSIRKKSQRMWSPKKYQSAPKRSESAAVQKYSTTMLHSKTSTARAASKKSTEGQAVADGQTSVWDPASPGMGKPPKGEQLAKVVKQIQHALDNEIYDQPYKTKPGMEVSMPELEWDPQQLKFQLKSMDQFEFWQQKGLQCAKQGKIDAAMDYYRQGLRRCPTEHALIYSVAVCYSQLKKYQSAMRWYSLGISLHPRWVDGLCGLAFSHFNMGDFEKALYYIGLARDNSKGSLLTNSQLSYEVSCFVYATCLKLTHRLDEASKAYIYLEDHFVKERRTEFKKLLWGSILIPLSDERKVIADHWINIKEYLEHLTEEPIPAMDDENLLLSKFCYGAKKNIDYKTGRLIPQVHGEPSKKLDLQNFRKTIKILLDSKPFFRRFATLQQSQSKVIYDSVVSRADVELFNKDQTVFLKARVGVVTMGSVEVRRHNDYSLLKPYIVKKAVQGDVLGFSDGDDNITGSALTWLVSMQNQTEVVFFEYEDWRKLWGLQKRFSEQQIVLNKLEQNSYFSCLNMVTKYHLVYECLELKIFYPGQLIMSVHERSPLCTETQEYYKDGRSKFRKEIDSKILRSQEATLGKKTVMSGYMIALRQGGDSPAARGILQRIHGQQNSMTPAFTKVTSIETTESALLESFSKEGSMERQERFKAKNASKQVSRLTLAAQKSMQSDTESNSTDYGISHAKELLRPDRTLAGDSMEEGIGMLELSNESLRTSEEQQDDDNMQNSFKPGCMSNIPELGIIENMREQSEDSSSRECDRLGDSSLERDSEALTMSSKRQQQHAQHRTSALQKEQNKSLSPFRFGSKIEKRNVSASPNPQSRPAQKHRLQHVVSGFDSPPKPFFEQSVTSPNRQTLHASSKQVTIKIQQQRGLGDLNSQTTGLNITTGEQQISEIRVSDLQPMKKRHQQLKKMSSANTNFKFLMKKKAQAILSSDKEAKRAHRRQKQQMRSLLKFCKEMQSSVLRQAKTNENILRSLKTMATEQRRQKESQLNLTSKNTIVQSRQIGKTIGKLTNMTSGIANTILIEQVNQMIERISDKVGHNQNNQQILYQAIVNAIDQSFEVKGRREEPTGVHFIDQGEVLVVDNEITTVQRLAKSDTFGFCDVLKQVGPEFHGDVRAGIRQVQTFYFAHGDFMKRLSTIEKIKLKTMEQKQEKTQQVVNLISSKTNIETGCFQPSFKSTLSFDVA